MPQKEKLEKMLRMGRSRFIWMYGVLFFGLTSAVFSSLIMAWPQEASLQGFLRKLSTLIIIFPICGYFWGMFMWHWAEKKHKALAKVGHGDEDG